MRLARLTLEDEKNELAIALQVLFLTINPELMEVFMIFLFSEPCGRDYKLERVAARQTIRAN